MRKYTVIILFRNSMLNKQKLDIRFTKINTFVPIIIILCSNTLKITFCLFLTPDDCFGKNFVKLTCQHKQMLLAAFNQPLFMNALSVRGKNVLFWSFETRTFFKIIWVYNKNIIVDLM